MGAANSRSGGAPDDRPACSNTPYERAQPDRIGKPGYTTSPAMVGGANMIEESRIRPLNRNEPVKGGYVLYWMQASQRAEYNHALEFAIKQANERKQPLIVYFGLTDAFPEANARHYHFMLEGLKCVQEDLKDRGACMAIERVSPQIGVLKFAEEASLVVCDCGYLRIQKQWRQHVADSIQCPLLQVESDVLVPVETASGKEEYSAATLRRKLLRAVGDYLVPLAEETLVTDSPRAEFQSYDVTNVAEVISNLDVDHSIKPVTAFHGGTREAKRRLQEFISEKLDRYEHSRNDPNEDCLSNLSPYLHFGQISPLYIHLQVNPHVGPGRDAFLDELIVRRELSMNFAHYNRHYDSFAGLPDWARSTLREHEHDPREYLYTLEQLEEADTHDPYWNAARGKLKKCGNS